ncbi:PREDICTED: probable apyrase 1 [Nelumbo nucifera]|uniref:Probable apyrase 1 n=1 Tax=Nelumbo nucifera TaxID=4432 RepID=A0A1U7ZZK0_NELNU|nr:PREDICTED: probable apyrase 1 [Nelumbo nucifera]
MLKRSRQQDSFSDKLHRYRGIILVVSVPLLLISFVLFLMPRSPSDDLISVESDNVRLGRRGSPEHRRSRSYAVIFDAGSSGSRVHVYCFDESLNLVPIRKDLELFVQKKPGLSAYANDPQKAADSLLSLLEQAEDVVPKELRHKTPVRVGATAGLRALEGDASDRILQAVRDFLEDKSSLKSKPEWVSVLDGTQEGAFQWVCHFELHSIYIKIHRLHHKLPREVSVEGNRLGEVQPDSRREAAVKKDVAICLGFQMMPPFLLKGSYKYGGHEYEVSSSASGSNIDKCTGAAFKALKVNESACTHMKCTFGGVWNGGGGDGQKSLFVASFFFDRAAEAGFIDPNQPVAKVRPVEFQEAAKRACETKLADAKSTYPHVEKDNLPYLCMDLVYQFTLLVDGFALDPWQEITLVKKVKYGNSLVEAAWPLGSAIEAASSST